MTVVLVVLLLVIGYWLSVIGQLVIGQLVIGQLVIGQLVTGYWSIGYWLLVIRLEVT